MSTNKHPGRGFTLIEMLLVLVIVSGIIYIGAGYLQQRALSLRIDRTSGQMQQILNAGMSYYISNNAWPSSLSDLQTAGYLPASMPSPWGGNPYTVYSTNSNLYVQVQLLTGHNTPSVAQTVIGTLPLAFTSQTGGGPPPPTAMPCVAATACFVTATVNIPPESLSGAQSVNFAGLYHNGACVPAPVCPTNYAPEVFVVPVEVNGYWSGPDPSSTNCTATNTSGCKMTYYPLNGYTAYPTSGSPTDLSTGTTPLDCGNAVATSSPCYTDSTNTTTLSSGLYWRVCISVTTSSGDVAPNDANGFQNPWGQLTGTVMVMTRCSPINENQGSNFTVWEPSTPGGT